MPGPSALSLSSAEHLRRRAIERIASSESDAVEIRHHDAVRLEESGLGVGDFLFCAEGSNNPSSFGKFGSRHTGEQVVLHLVVEASHEVVHEQPTTDVATGQDLATKEVDLDARSNLRHALVVGGERGPHIDTKEGHVDDEEDCCDIPGHESHQDEGITDVAGEQQSDFCSAVLEWLSAEHSLECLNVKVQALESQDRKEQPALSLHESFSEA